MLLIYLVAYQEVTYCPDGELENLGYLGSFFRAPLFGHSVSVLEYGFPLPKQCCQKSELHVIYLLRPFETDKCVCVLLPQQSE